MRDAFPGQFEGHGSMGGGMLNDPNRVSNLHRAIDSIEQRINSQGVASTGKPSYGDLGVMQQKLNQLSSQVGLTPSMSANIPGSGSLPEFDAATADIMRRQHALNGADAAAAAQQQAKQQDAAVHAIAEQFNSLKAELGALRKDVAKPITVQSKISKNEISRIAESLSGMQKAPVLDDKAFGKLTQELADLRNTMQQDLQKEMSATQGISNRLDALVQGVDTMAAQTSNSIAPRVDNLTTQLDAMRTTIEDLPQSLSITSLEKRLQEMSGQINALPTAAPESAPTDLSSVEKRLDEVARALVAVSNMGDKTPKVDLSGLDRLEQRFNDMNNAIDEMGKSRIAAVENEQVQALSRRIEGLTDRLGHLKNMLKPVILAAQTRCLQHLTRA